MNVLGISCFFHDSAAALLVNGDFVAGAHEERFTRIKHDSAFPLNSIQYCLNKVGLKPEDIDAVVYYEKPFLKFERILENYLDVAPSGFRSFSKAIPVWLGEKLFTRKNLGKSLLKLGFEKDIAEKLLFSGHHLSHASSAFYSSPFNDAAILTLDGVGEWATATLGHGNENGLYFFKELNYPDSPGLLYSAFTYFLGFRVNSGEYKVMGLAPYGRPVFKDLILEKMIQLKEDGSFRLNQKYFRYRAGLTMTTRHFSDLLCVEKRDEKDALEQVHKDIAASIQSVIEEIVVRMSKTAIALSGSRNLCLAGGVALNCTANGRLLREGICDELYVQPASGDAGGALGAALAYWHLGLKKPKSHDQSVTPVSKKSNYESEGVSKQLDECHAVYKNMDWPELYSHIAQKISEGKVVAWYQGEMEWGPRALGNRSILADPRNADMKSILNEKIKMRESFRPFAPAVLPELADQYFESGIADAYMTRVCIVRDEIVNGKAAFNLPAITHVDGTARVQLVDKNERPEFYNLLKAVYELTGCAVLVNTSFNLRGEPPVCSVKDAFATFMHSGIDILVVHNCILYKENQQVVPSRPFLSGD